MSNDQIITRPTFKTGDRVVYVGGQVEDEDSGTVIGVETIVRYNYVVKWDDDNSVDIYAGHQLSAEE